MQNQPKPEVWLRGPLPEISDFLQPAAHALLQAQEEINAELSNFPVALLWERPADVASVGFHLQHLTGVLDRLFTYARAESLSENQLAYLKSEGQPLSSTSALNELLDAFNRQILIALTQLKHTDEETLTQIRYVGRAMLPSTHLGLLFHAAEHTQRHTGQLLVTSRMLKQSA
ncbi:MULTISPECIES: DinB family protein [Dyadobacter]|uniref:DinB family protein n=1 Tax=Dyadobacter chenhuakuii TaxID=2909339 RepID=A0ABY4XRN5_9BACT|nr:MULTISPECIES: DinB family protein [Dyadobacter]MCF2492600.1 DinB family protein [Dyadobacter chenhuakuii]MCF2520383.1 DinB family protein [Dyadobacter sp. CY351]USJ33106.1 DinB family protein [Dyadobacter chenhuakuii]